MMRVRPPPPSMLGLLLLLLTGPWSCHKTDSSPGASQDAATAIAPSPSRLTPLVERLSSADEMVREEAASELDALAQMGLTVEEGLEALGAATRKYPPRFAERDDSAAELVRAVAPKTRGEYVPKLVEIFPKLSDAAKWEALKVLGLTDTPSAAQAYVDILKRHAASGEVPKLCIRPLQERLNHADIYFPALIDFAHLPSLQLNIFEITLNYLVEKKLAPERVASMAAPLLSTFEDLRERYIAFKGQHNKTKDYLTFQYRAGIVLDLMGYSADPRVAEALRQAIHWDNDPRLRQFAVVSLLRQKQQVPPAIIEKTAAHYLSRALLYQGLLSIGRADLFPKKYLSQSYQAVSALAGWLIQSTELFWPPEQVLVVSEEKIQVDDETVRYFVMKFRVGPPHELAKVGWMAGCAGPYRDTSPVSFQPTLDTFSEYLPLKSRTPRQHLDVPRRIETLREERKKPGFLDPDCVVMPSPHACMLPPKGCARKPTGEAPETFRDP